MEKRKKKKSLIEQSLEERFQFWLWEVFAVEEYYSAAQLENFLNDPLARMTIFDEFIQTEFVLPYTDEYIQLQLKKFKARLYNEA